ncbi:hypothetical protein FDI95_gp051 [Citrobacter phage CF1 ERZ-2017]|uniref:Uncharacterized protein n=1 Tax=Citrobacter phage CF1 ERZ-2017 TaxID=2267236 RepID=A0A2H4YFZ2_9CAUD|nr:hypothetical protein FDI95_gp051 [Citrobacter phage CF1 ERZ-2017]AUE22924.1 hypothetical protein Cf1_00051 [Citrobacter phage CF1 ERZ-2017]
MTNEIKQEIMKSMKIAYGLSHDQTLFDLDEKEQLEFQKEFEKATNPDYKVFQAIIKTCTSSGVKYTRYTVEI